MHASKWNKASVLRAEEILGQAMRKWPAVLRAEAAGEILFPLRVRFGRPSTTDDLGQLRREMETLESKARGWRIEWQELRTRKWGLQRWPMRVVFDSIDDMAVALGRSAELAEVREAIQHARDVCPALEPWLRANAHRIADNLSDWHGLVAVCAHFDANPRPNCFARQVAAPVDTKFIGAHESILRELLDATLGERANRDGLTFAERFHLRVEPATVRFRFLDVELQERVGWPVSECTIAASAFAGLTWRIPRVVIVENRDVFLCLPRVPGTVAVFGAGKAAALLTACHWMAESDLVYWGDCDDAGYGILSALRERFPALRSVLMDEAAWARWSHLATRGKRDDRARHTHLLGTERAAYAALIAGPWMLEQERIPPEDAHGAILAAFDF